ncbi:MAG: acetylxylan esterase [Paludibacteraceae bacterium]|nr:acetylxylan esterase [Paludibacteraceae bacterium]
MRRFFIITCSIVAMLYASVPADATVSLWTGAQVMPNDWSRSVRLDASSFANAQAGQVLRIQFEAIGVDARLQMKNAEDWAELADAPLSSICGRHYDYRVTPRMLTELQKLGVRVGGCNYTLTGVLLLDSAELKPLMASVPVTGNWVFGDRPAIVVHVENPYSEPMPADIEVEITTDQLRAVQGLRQSGIIPANGAKDFSFTTTMTLPAGFYKAVCLVNDDLARAFTFGVNPTAIVSAPDARPDFDAFWAAAKQQLEAIPMDAVLTEIPSKSTAARKVYLVEMNSIPDGLSGEPVVVRGYYCEPQDGKQHPVIIHYAGYDSGYRPGGQDVIPYCASGDAERDYAEFFLATRGQNINNRAASEREPDGKGDFTNTYGDWFAFHFGDKDSYYYRGAFMDCVQAVRFMATRPTSDMTNLFAEGHSQGGAFTYAAAALSDYPFRAIAPAIAFLGDYPDYFATVHWPAYVARANQGTMTDESMYAFLSYFDTKNLAVRITCPVIACIGLQDDVCPPHTNIAPYNNVRSVIKELRINPERKHRAADTWYDDWMRFFRDNMIHH